MKKLVAIFAIAVVLTACNNNIKETVESKLDSAITESPLMDAVNTADSVGKVMEAAKDTALKVIEEVNDAAK